MGVEARGIRYQLSERTIVDVEERWKREFNGYPPPTKASGNTISWALSFALHCSASLRIFARVAGVSLYTDPHCTTEAMMEGMLVAMQVSLGWVSCGQDGSREISCEPA